MDRREFLKTSAALGVAITTPATIMAHGGTPAAAPLAQPRAACERLDAEVDTIARSYLSLPSNKLSGRPHIPLIHAACCEQNDLLLADVLHRLAVRMKCIPPEITIVDEVTLGRTTGIYDLNQVVTRPYLLDVDELHTRRHLAVARVLTGVVMDVWAAWRAKIDRAVAKARELNHGADPHGRVQATRIVTFMERHAYQWSLTGYNTGGGVVYPFGQTFTDADSQIPYIVYTH